MQRDDTRGSGEARTPRKAYQAPTVRTYGNIRVITQSKGELGANDGSPNGKKTG